MAKMNIPQFLLLLFSLIPLCIKAQERELIYSPTFQWVDEKEKTTIHSFEGGGRQYSYDQLRHSPLAKIDSAVIWVNGIRETIPSFELNENGQAQVQVKEDADTLWFFARGKKAIFYHDAVMMQGSSRSFPVYFIEKEHIPVRHGFHNKPMRVNESTYVVLRNFETCTTNEAWEKTVASWSKQYAGVVSYHTHHAAHLYFLGKKKEYTKEVIRLMAAHTHTQFVSVELTDVLANNTTHFINSHLVLYTETASAQVEEQAKTFGFTLLRDRTSGHRYEMRYTKNKHLNLPFIKASQKLIHSLSAKYGTNDYYYEVRLD
jgi:hypothetical protein